MNPTCKLKALYYPYTSPQNRESILRGLLLYEKLGAIQPRHFFVTGVPHADVYATELERLHEECENYSHDNPLFVLDPKDLLQGRNGKLFSEAVVSDMKNPEFRVNSPTGSMTVYADKITRPLFAEFQDQIRPLVGIGPESTVYREGPYQGSEHFIWNVQEPLAHSILLNLTLIGLNMTDSVPVTDSPESQRAFLTKTAPHEANENVRMAAETVVNLALPSATKLDIRAVLDFRDGHKQDLTKFWKLIGDEQNLLGGAFDEGKQLSAIISAKYQALKERIEDAKSDLKWNVPGIGLDLLIGFSGYPVGALALAVGHTTLTGMKYMSKRYKNTTGMSYLLKLSHLSHKAHDSR